MAAISWAVGGADAVEVLLLTDQYWGSPGPRLHSEPRMDRRGHGRRVRPAPATPADDRRRADDRYRTGIPRRDRGSHRRTRTPLLDALGDDLDELLAHLDAWSEAIIDAGSYPRRIAGVYNVGGGPHFGSGLTIDTAAEQYGAKT